MGNAKLNIWVRDEKCRIIKRSGHLHIYNCLGEQVFVGWVINNGHAEVEVPPGCYTVVAGMVYGNIYSDRAMVIVNCGEHACVNLILPKYDERDNQMPQLAPRNLLAVGGCAVRLIPALGIHAINKKIDPKEIIDVLIKTAEIDRKQLIVALERDIEDMKENLDEIRKASPEEEKEAREYTEILVKIKNMIG
ncbi:MAG: hypothetical protein E4H21_11485 [Thermodesulfobacteriales bacterium]|nr:MAG: hypothetical protein E4H21_11485 [Thermodesulfobacteriales bacterium]